MTHKVGEPQYDRRVPRVGNKYRIKDGRYIGLWCRCISFAKAHDFAVVVLMDTWGKETKSKDAIPLKFLEL